MLVKQAGVAVVWQDKRVSAEVEAVLNAYAALLDSIACPDSTEQPSRLSSSRQTSALSLDKPGMKWQPCRQF